jgi:hypothetical protein
MSYKKLMKKIIQEKYFRMLILGMTGSGKTYFLANSVLPVIRKDYDIFIVITRTYNKKVYEQLLEKNHVPKTKSNVFTPELQEILPLLHTIKIIQSESPKSYDKDGHPIFEDNILIIFDDILDEIIMRNTGFLELFNNFRHIQVSVILLSQITNRAITNQMKANTHYTVMFNLMGPMQSMYPKQLLTEALLNKYNGDKNKAKVDAEKLYSARVQNKKYGFLIVDNAMNIY